MIVTFARFDLLSWFPRRQTLLTVLLVAAVGVVLPLPGMAIIAAGLGIGVLGLLIGTGVSAVLYRTRDL